MSTFTIKPLKWVLEEPIAWEVAQTPWGRYSIICRDRFTISFNPYPSDYSCGLGQYETLERAKAVAEGHWELHMRQALEQA